jgi:hypothetical protein
MRLSSMSNLDVFVDFNLVWLSPDIAYKNNPAKAFHAFETERREGFYHILDGTVQVLNRDIFTTA